MMNGSYLLKSALLVLTGISVLAPSAAYAYIGPGAGISAIGSLLALLAAIAAAIFGFLWYPIKRLLSRRRKSSEAGQATEAEMGPNK
jgi:hypothetical protein